MSRGNGRLAMLLFIIPVCLYGMFAELPDFYIGKYADDKGNEILQIREDHTGYAPAGVLPESGFFKWRIMPEEMNMLYLTYPNGKVVKLWLGEQANANGYTGFDDKHILLVDSVQFSIRTIGFKVDTPPVQRASTEAIKE